MGNEVLCMAPLAIRMAGGGMPCGGILAPFFGDSHCAKYQLLRAIQLGFINRLLGGVFGMVKWLVVVLVVVFCINMLDSYFHFLDNSKVVQTSTLYRPFVQTAEQIAHTFPNVADSVIIQSAAPMPK